MPLLVNDKVYNLFHFGKEDEFEKLIEQKADSIFGASSIYISKKKRMKGSEIISIPDGYLIDMTDPMHPALYVIENEIVSHDPFKHIGIQLLKFATSFEEARYELKQHLMSEIAADKEKQKRLEEGWKASNHRNIDSYLEQAVYGEFKALVLIDEARPELHNVIEKIKADISVLEFKAYQSDSGDFIYQFDSFYEVEDEEAPSTEVVAKSMSNDERLKRRLRRAQCDTVVVPAHEEGFKRVFLGQHQWFAIRISPAMKERIKYIAAYQVAPVSAITYIAEVDSILPYQNTGKYLLKFKIPAIPITPIGLINPDKKPQGPIYIKFSDLNKAKSIDELMQF